MTSKLLVCLGDNVASLACSTQGDVNHRLHEGRCACAVLKNRMPSRYDEYAKTDTAAFSREDQQNREFYS